MVKPAIVRKAVLGLDVGKSSHWACLGRYTARVVRGILGVDLASARPVLSTYGGVSGDYIRVAQTIHVEDEIARYEGPVLIVHGDEDESVPFFYAEKAERLYKNAKLVPIPGDDHCFNLHVDMMAEAIKEFLISL